MSEDDEEYKVKVDENSIYFYDEVNDNTILKFNIELKKLERKLSNQKDANITVFINSIGGDVFGGLSALDHIQSCSVQVTTVADGLCCSAATLIFLGGHVRLIKRHAHFLIHQVSSESGWTKFEEMKDELKNTESLMETMVNVYREYTTLPEKKLKRMMKHDMYLLSHDCIKYGIASDVYCDT
jgi:ATP-dependent protease ClpP protease subunit